MFLGAGLKGLAGAAARRGASASAEPTAVSGGRARTGRFEHDLADMLSGACPKGLAGPVTRRGAAASAEPAARSGGRARAGRVAHALIAALFVACPFGLACGSGPAPAGAPAPEAPRLAPLAPVARIETADVWQDLLAQRPSAVVLAEGRLLVDLGQPQSRKHLDLGGQAAWRLGEELGEQRTGLVFGAGGSLTLPVDGELAPALHPDVDGQPALAMAITLRALAPGQTVTALWNEQPLANLPLGEDWERRTFSLPQAQVRPGENKLRLHFARPAPAGQPTAAVQRVEIGPRAAITAGPPASADAAYRVLSGEADDVALQLSPGTSLVFYALAPRRGRLRVDARGRGGLAVLVSTDADHREGRPPTALLEEPLRPTGGAFDLDLSGYGGEPLRIELRVSGGGEGAGAAVRALHLVARRSMPVDRRERRPRDLYVFVVEGARPDDLLGVLLRGPRFPAVERMAGEALVFERAYAVSPWAVPTHAALLSSVPPPAHATVRGTFVADGQVLLPELLDRAGYYGLATAANADFGGERGLSQGFDATEILTRGAGAGNDARAVVRAALRHATGKPGPFFLYADAIDPQAPYDPPREYAAGPAPPGAPLPHLTHLWLGRVRTGHVVPDAAQKDYLRRLYRGELQVVDAALGELLADLEARGALDESVVVLVGAHGEEFFEHGGVGHGLSLYEESLRVPLLIRAPALLAPGRVVAPVDLLDLAPTLADLLGLPFPSEWQGDTLVPLIDDPQPPPRLVVAYLGDGSRAAIVGDLKLIVGSGRDAQRLYDLAADPGEAQNLVDRGGIGLRLLRTALVWEQSADGRWKRARWGTGANLRPAFALDHGM